MIGQKDKDFIFLRIMKFNTAEAMRTSLKSVFARKLNNLVSEDVAVLRNLVLSDNFVGGIWQHAGDKIDAL